MSESHSIYNGKARNFNELCQAYRLVQRKYEELGYARAARSGMRYSIFNLLKETATFTAVFEENVVATATLIEDSPLTLPLSKDYNQEYHFLKSEYGSLAEGSMFACESDFQNKGMGVQLSLLQKMISRCLERRIRTLCLIVNPKHLGFYQKVLGFHLMTEARSCSHVESAPGLLIYRSVDSNKADLSLFGKYINQCTHSNHSFDSEYYLSHDEKKCLLKLNPMIYLELSNKEKELFLNSIGSQKLLNLSSKEKFILSKSLYS